MIVREFGIDMFTLWYLKWITNKDLLYRAGYSTQYYITSREGLRAGGEGDDRGWDGWMASLTRWTWVWVNSGSWWWTGRPGVLWFMGSQRVGHDWVTELNWTELGNEIYLKNLFQTNLFLKYSKSILRRIDTWICITGSLLYTWS